MEMIQRLRAKTPLFFRRLRNVALSLGACCLAANQACPIVGFDNHFLISFFKYGVVACAFIAGTSQLTRQEVTTNN